MLEWLSRLFNRKPPHPGEQWRERENLTVTLELSNGELRLDDGTVVTLGSQREALCPFGRPHDAAKYSHDFFQYPKFGLLVTTEDGVIDSIGLDLVSGVKPLLSFDGRAIELDEINTEEGVVSILGPPLGRNDEGLEDFGEVILEYRIRKGVFSEWCFERGQLVDIDFCDYGEDPLHPDEKMEENTPDEDNVW